MVCDQIAMSLKNRIITFVFLSAFVVLALPGCERDDPTPLFVPEFLAGSEKVGTMTRQEIQALIAGNDFFPSGVQFLVLYDVEAIRIHYHTVTAEGDPVVASGALLVPRTSQVAPLLSFQHGTITDPAEAPSLFDSDYTEQSAIFASTGFIIALPDYLGYGVTAGTAHPYEHRATLATATRDMIRASREYFVDTRHPGPSSQLFLTGYSEGGFATMSALKLLQEEHREEFQVTAATVGAGAYNKTASTRWALEAEEELEHINSFLWVLDSYNRIYPSLRRSLQDYVNEPWASELEAGGVFAPVERNPRVLFREGFVQGVLEGTDTAFLEALSDNDVYDWKPEMPLRLYHGTADRLVPFLNSDSALEAMSARGAPDVVLIETPEGTHDTSFMDYIAGTFMFFLQVRE